MKKTSFIISLYLLTSTAFSQYKPIDGKSSVDFKIENFGFTVNGKFSGIDGVINFDPSLASNGSIDITVNAATVNTDNNLRDEHLRGENYFDIKNYPSIHFVSTKIELAGKMAFNAVGKLTIKGKTKDVSIPFTATAENDEYLFKGSFKMNRRDFDIGGTSTISNELEVFVTVAASNVKS